MNYLGYNIHIRGRVWQRDMIEANIAAQNGECISIYDSDSVSAATLAREIVDYATCHRLTLATSATHVLC